MDHVRSLRTLHVVLCFSTQYPDASAPYFFYALSVLRFLNISVSCCSQSCFSGSLRQTVLGSNFLIWAIIFHYLYVSPKLQYSGCSSLFTQFHVWASKTKNRTGSSFPPPYLLFLTLIYPFFNTSGHLACLCSSYPCHIVPSFFTLYSFLSSFILSCTHPHHPSTPLSFTDNLLRVAPLPFSSFKLSPPFTTQNPRGKKARGKKPERRTWERKKGSLISKALNPILYHG